MISGNRIFQFMRIILPVPIYRQRIQEPGLFQYFRQSPGPEKIKQKIQIKLGIICHNQRPLRSLQQSRKSPGRRLVFYAFGFQPFLRDARQTRNKGVQAPSLRQADKNIHFVCLCSGLQHNRTDFNNSIPDEINTCGLRIKDHHPVKLLPQLHAASSSSQLSPVA